MRRHPVGTSHRLITLAAVAALALAGCAKQEAPGIATADGGGVAGTPSADPQEMARLLARCMRDNGIEVDDPDGQGVKGVVGQQQHFDKQKFAQAMEKCRQYAPEGGAPRKAIAPEDIDLMRRHAQCMREHGFPDWPDPDPVTGAAKWDDPAKARAAKADPGFKGALDACKEFDLPR